MYFNAADMFTPLFDTRDDCNRLRLGLFILFSNMDNAVKGSRFRLRPSPCMIRCVPRFKIVCPARLAPRLNAFFNPTPLVMSFKTWPASSFTIGRMTSFSKGAPKLLTMLNNLEPSPLPD